MTPLFKYPRTHHIQGSRTQPGDEELNTLPFSTIAHHPIVSVPILFTGQLTTHTQLTNLLTRSHFITDRSSDRSPPIASKPSASNSTTRPPQNQTTN